MKSQIRNFQFVSMLPIQPMNHINRDSVTDCFKTGDAKVRFNQTQVISEIYLLIIIVRCNQTL